MKVEVVPEKMFRCIKLEWESIPIDRNHTKFVEAIPGRWSNQTIGLYAIEGKHDGHRQGTILYIGMTVEQAGGRPVQSVTTRLFREKKPRTMYGTYWDLILRWAPLIPEELFPGDPDMVGKTEKLAGALENLLIVSMKPPLNAQDVDGWLDKEAWDLIVGNAGDKGLLLPMLHGHECFFTHKEKKSIGSGVPSE